MPAQNTDKETWLGRGTYCVHSDGSHYSSPCMLAALWVKCLDSWHSETWVFTPHNFGLWVESRAHTQLPQSCLPALKPLQTRRMALGQTGNSRPVKRQEVIWLAWNFIKLWVELHGVKDSLSKKPPFIDQARLQTGEKAEQHPYVCGC